MSEASGRRRIAVVGGGWAGIAAAVEATRCGMDVTLFELAGSLGGRARQVEPRAGSSLPPLDNGQHILIGAYRETLRLLERVGISAEDAFERLPLTLRYPGGDGLELPPGPPALAFVRAVLKRRGWTIVQRCALLCAAAEWGARRFSCPADWTVERLVGWLPQPLIDDLVEPLCVAALNTPASEASAKTFLRILRDALFGGAGSADLLLPRIRLGDLLPRPATRWLQTAGASIRLHHRIERLQPRDDRWAVDAEVFDGVVLATNAHEAARLVAPIDASWVRSLAELVHAPIVTGYLLAGTTRLAAPMLLLRAGENDRPAQFVFDLGRLGGPVGLLAFVISDARRWVDAGSEATWLSITAQARAELGLAPDTPLTRIRLIAEKRATFRCTPGLLRPRPTIATGLQAAGDYVAGPYPATLEGAVRSGFAAARAMTIDAVSPGAR